MVNVKALHSSWAKKQQLRAEQESIKNFERELKDAAKKEKEDRRKKMEERQKRKEENAKKSEIVQEVCLFCCLILMMTFCSRLTSFSPKQYDYT